MSKDYGGHAFPIQAYTRPNGDFQWEQEGMTLRDWFAGKALESHSYHTSIPPDEEGYAEQVASLCYGIADAMIAEKNKEEQG